MIHDDLYFIVNLFGLLGIGPAIGFALAGTKRPQRQFLAFLRPRNGQIRELPECSSLPTFKPLKFPFELDLEKLPHGSDVGNCGLWNQWEFAKLLAKACKGKPQDWLFRQLEVTQRSLAHHVALYVTEDAEQPCQTKPKVPHPGPAPPSDDYEFFLMKELLPGNALPKLQPDMKTPKGKECESDISEFSDLGAMTDLEDMLDANFNVQEKMQAELKLKDADPAQGSAKEKSVELGSHPKAPSEAGSDGSHASRIKTIATDTDLLESSLREISRPVMFFIFLHGSPWIWLASEFFDGLIDSPRDFRKYGNQHQCFCLVCHYQ